MICPKSIDTLIMDLGTTPDDCGDPGTPAFGTRFGNDFRVGATVYYECNSGYRLEGSESRQCQASGVWTGRLPQCIEITKSKYNLKSPTSVFPSGSFI